MYDVLITSVSDSQGKRWEGIPIVGRDTHRWTRSSVRSVTMANTAELSTQSWPPIRAKKGAAAMAETGRAPSRWPAKWIRSDQREN